MGEIYVGGAGARARLCGQSRRSPRGASCRIRSPPAPRRAAVPHRRPRAPAARRQAIQFLGRVDYQVKVRGFRVEPGEIEAALRAHPAVREAAVLVREVPGRGREPGGLPRLRRRGAALRRPGPHLRARLPEYMVPAAFVPLAALPLTPNGKVDREALARLAPPERCARGDAAGHRDRGEAAAPVVAKSSRVAPCRMRRRASSTSAGHSLLATRLVGRIRAACGVELPLRALFEAPTVREAAVARRRGLAARPAPAAPIVPRARGGPAAALLRAAAPVVPGAARARLRPTTCRWRSRSRARSTPRASRRR